MAACIEQFGDYELRQRVAVGGMAEIFLARRRRPGGFSKLVAVKRVLPELATQEEFRKMFADEARLCASLNHPGLVQVFDYGEVDGVPFLVMEWVAGCDLATLLRDNGPLPAQAAAFVMAEVARALAHVHAARDENGRPLHIVHRDLSPGNVLLGREGDVKLGDFGVAQARGRLARTDAGRLKGTLAYLAPEQVLGEHVDHRTDIYAVGLLLFEALTGERYVGGSSEVELLQAAMRPQRRTASSLVPGLGTAFDRILERALSPDREGRQRDADELEADLRRLCGDAAAARALVIRAVGKAAGERDERRRTEVACVEPPTWRARLGQVFRGPGRLLASIGVALLLVAGGAWVVMQDGATEDLRERPVPAIRDETGSRMIAPQPAPASPATGPVTGDGAEPPHTEPTVEAERPTGEDGREPVRRPAHLPRDPRPAHDDQPGAAPDEERPVPPTPAPGEAATEPGGDLPPGPGALDPPREPAAAQLLRDADGVRRARGIRAGDDAEADGLRTRAAALAASNDDPAGAEEAARAYQSRVEGIAIDQVFVDRKMRRASRAIQDVEPGSDRAAQLDALSQQALRAAMSRDFEGANRLLNRIFDLLAR